MILTFTTRFNQLREAKTKSFQNVPTEDECIVNVPSDRVTPYPDDESLVAQGDKDNVDTDVIGSDHTNSSIHSGCEQSCGDESCSEASNVDGGDDSIEDTEINYTYVESPRSVQGFNRNPTVMRGTNIRSPPQSEGHETCATPPGPPQIAGRRISDPLYFYEEILKMQNEHGHKDLCTPANITFNGVHDMGLNTRIKFVCRECGYHACLNVTNQDSGNMPLNMGAAVGSVYAGIGYSELRQVLAALDVPCMSDRTYRNQRLRLMQFMLEASEESMKLAIEEEKRLAILNGDVINGIPFITVIVDGSWGKRSYKSGQYDSLSGCAAIIGARTKKVLYVGVRNKYCYACSIAASKNVAPSEHHKRTCCFKNWGRDQSSSSMEKHIIVQGFKESVKKHGVIYKVMIADGDSSVYKAVRDSKPYRDYRVQVEKIECKNHLLRNLCNKIKDAAKGRITLTRGNVKTFRELVTRGAFKVRKHIAKLVKVQLSRERSKDQEQALQNQILDSTNHCFGDHRNCERLQVPCDPKPNEKNWVPVLISTKVYFPIKTAVSNLSCHVKSLLCNETNNPVESFNSIIAKLLGGKRVNYSARESYTLRVHAAVVQFNDQSLLSSIIETGGYNKSEVSNAMENRQRARIISKKALRLIQGRRKRRAGRGADADYGEAVQQPDVDASAYEVLKENHIRQLKEDQKNKIQIEKDTRDQSGCEEWHELRSERCCSSHFGRICRLRDDTSRGNVVKDILYPSVTDLPAFRYGLQKEEEARTKISKMLKKDIQKAGLTIADGDEYYLATSVDGFIDDDGVLEIKSPISAKNLTFRETMTKKPALRRIFADKNGEQMNPNHYYYHQVQGQLHITGRAYCIFALVTGKSIHLVTVERDDEFWKNKMAERLRNFYFDCLQPEILDSRYNREMPMREPDYVIRAQAAAALRKKSKAPQTKNPKILKNTRSSKTSRPTKKGPSKAQIAKKRPMRKPKATNVVAHVQTSSISQIPNETMPMCVEESNPDRHGTPSDVPLTAKDRQTILLALDSNINMDEVSKNVLNVNQKLTDDAINALLQVASKHTSDYEIHPPIYFRFLDDMPEEIRNWNGKTHLQIIGGEDAEGGCDHWICYKYDGKDLLIYDSLNREFLDEEVVRYFNHRYPNIRRTKIVYVPVTQQPDGKSCGVYASAFLTHIILGNDPSAFHFSENATMMRNHLYEIIVTGRLRIFPKNQSTSKTSLVRGANVTHSGRSGEKGSSRGVVTLARHSQASGISQSHRSQDLSQSRERRKFPNSPRPALANGEDVVHSRPTKRLRFDIDCIEITSVHQLTELPERNRIGARRFFDERELLLEVVLERVYRDEKLNDDTIDFFLRLVDKHCGDKFSIQSVNYITRPELVEPVSGPAIQIIGGDCTDHWRTILFENGVLHVYDSLSGFGPLVEPEIVYVSKRFPSLNKGNILYHKMSIRQTNIIICGVYACCTTASAALGTDAYEIPKIPYATTDMIVRRHLAKIMITGILTPFPRQT
ncbi:hypothetical protein QAD02_005437 [Eretmocerus hayati]|uniref:Uncharacterized protein n=2 Tax=Eretmocerus hayati TaxID=131215 RepID=A0ACC2NXA8_9HYME|nr:hypothetical protein QAD02_004789 [Eretmocerus hayati]KAJ8674175.1 hypothetical protein QAD02_005437 [Eretmocerus hayati]